MAVRRHVHRESVETSPLKHERINNESEEMSVDKQGLRRVALPAVLS